MSVADTLFRTMLAGMGVTPEQIQSVFTLLVDELTVLRAERAAFKEGANKMVAMFVDRLEAHTQDNIAILHRLEQLEALIRDMTPACPACGLPPSRHRGNGDAYVQND
jgi:hypothetical protein